MKKCSRCKDLKSLDLFSRDRSRADGYSARCKSCDSNKQAVWCAANIEKRKATNAAWYILNADREKAQAAAYRLAHPGCFSTYERQRKQTDPLFRLTRKVRSAI